MRVVITCAGTGGHINPAIAIADLIKSKNINCEILFIGTKLGLENDLVTKSGYPIESIKTGKFLRKLTLKNIISMYNSCMGILDCKKILKRFKPDLVIGTGGYICIPVMIASKSLNIPYMLHESNAYPGLSIKLLYKNSACTMVGFKETKVRLKEKDNVVYTGTPCKFNEKQINLLDKDKCKKELALDINKKIIFVTFGSQGAKFLNKTIIEMIKQSNDKEKFYVLVTGKNNYDEVKKLINEMIKESGIDLYELLRVEKFIYEMEKMYKVADLCIARSGAMTINELEICRKPSILIPLPYATENHQLYNAKVLENIQSSIIIEEKFLTTELLYNKINEILNNDFKIKCMIENFSRLEKKDVLESIYKEIEKVLK